MSREFIGDVTANKICEGHGNSVRVDNAALYMSRPTPDKSRLTPDNSRLTPDNSRLTPDKSRLTPDKRWPTPDKSRLTPDNSRLTPDNSRLTPDKRWPTPDKSRLTPNNGRKMGCPEPIIIPKLNQMVFMLQSTFMSLKAVLPTRYCEDIKSTATYSEPFHSRHIRLLFSIWGGCCEQEIAILPWLYFTLATLTSVIRNMPNNTGVNTAIMHRD